MESSRHLLLEPDLVRLPDKFFGPPAPGLDRVVRRRQDVGETGSASKATARTAAHLEERAAVWPPPTPTKSTVVMHSLDFGKTWNGQWCWTRCSGRIPPGRTPDGRILVAFTRAADIRLPVVGRRRVAVLPR